MSNVNNNSRSSFFPNSKTARAKQAAKKQYQKFSRLKAKDNRVPMNQESSSVEIPEVIKDFSRIKDLATNAPEIDNNEKIEILKNKIESGAYQIDYDKLAEQMLLQELS